MISVIIPTLNEEESIAAIIEHTTSMAADRDLLEIIVVDAGSTDGTLDVVSELSVQSFDKPEFSMKKYESLNFGFKKACADIVLFLDADTRLPHHFDLLILEKMEDSRVVGGAFEFSFENPDWKLQAFTLVNRIRYRLDKTFYGDQAIFARRSVLQAIGGVPHKLLMEAAYLSKALSKKGHLALIKSKIETSPRRFVDHGPFKVAWFDINMFIRFNLGLPVDRYAHLYWSKNLKE